jgi:major membrane immunogen (membrane-anchored lipoprotein)
MVGCAVVVAALVGVACGASDDGSKLQNAQPAQTTTTKPPLPDGACVASMKDPNPDQGGTETVIIDSHFPSVAATFTVHYKSTDSNYSAQLDANGHAEAQFSIGHPTSNFAVKVDVNINGQESCSTNFTPR